MDKDEIKLAITAGLNGIRAFGQNGPGANGSMMGAFGLTAVNAVAATNKPGAQPTMSAPAYS